MVSIYDTGHGGLISAMTGNAMLSGSGPGLRRLR